MVWISRLYALFVGIILTLTVGFGIAAFYPEPIRPIYPVKLQRPFEVESCFKTPESAKTPECIKLEQERQEESAKYEEKLRVYENENAAYTRTTIFFGITLGAMFTIISLTQIKKSKLIAHGLILSGVLTMLLTRFIVMLASLGSSATGTTAANTLGIIEFAILVFLSLLVIFVGKKNLQENN